MSELKTFREIYDAIEVTQKPTPKKDFVLRIADVAKCSESAVRCWLAGAYQPSELAQEVISKELGVPADVLFPKKEEVCEQ